jgi:hypothetical protein
MDEKQVQGMLETVGSQAGQKAILEILINEVAALSVKVAAIDEDLAALESELTKPAVKTSPKAAPAKGKH